MESISQIQWPNTLRAHRDMCYESLELLYVESDPNTFGDNMAFAVSCSRLTNDLTESQPCIHKLEVTTAPDFFNAKMKVTHEVLPGQGNCSNIITANSELKVAGFNSGAIIPIKNFGPKKTFNCDVRGRLVNHAAPISCLARSSGNSLANGSTDGVVGLYSTEGDQISFLTRKRVAHHPIAGLTYFKPAVGLKFTRLGITVEPSDLLIAYATSTGIIGIIDSRCVGLASELKNHIFMETNPRLYFTSMCHVAKSSANVFYLGTCDGELVAVDFRHNNRLIKQQKLQEDGCIRKIMNVTVDEENITERSFLAYTNDTNSIKIIDVNTWKPDKRWICDRDPGQPQKGICQVGDRLVTCGNKTSIGCWYWDDSNKRRDTED